MKAILLCAGYATRLYPLTKDRPKPLLPVGDRPIIEWILERIKVLPELSEVFVATNHRFASHFSEWAREAAYPWPVTVVDDQTDSNETRLGAIGDLQFVLTKKKVPASEDLIVIAGDNLFDFDLKKFYQEAVKNRPNAVIAVFDVGQLELAKQYGLVRLDAKNRVLEFFEKPQNPVTTLASCGIYWLPSETRVLLDRYLREGHNPDQPGHYMRWLAQEGHLLATPLQGRWFDIGDLTSYENANALVRSSESFQKTGGKIF